MNREFRQKVLYLFQKINGEFDRIKTDYEQLKMHNHEELNQEIVELRQTNDVSLRKQQRERFVYIYVSLYIWDQKN